MNSGCATLNYLNRQTKGLGKRIRCPYIQCCDGSSCQLALDFTFTPLPSDSRQVDQFYRRLERAVQRAQEK